MRPSTTAVYDIGLAEGGLRRRVIGKRNDGQVGADGAPVNNDREYHDIFAQLLNENNREPTTPYYRLRGNGL